MPQLPVNAICTMTKEILRIRKESKEIEWDIKVYVKESDKGNHEIVKKQKISVLVHAILIVIRTLRDHRGGGDFGSFEVVFVTDKGLRVESE